MGVCALAASIDRLSAAIDTLAASAASLSFSFSSSSGASRAWGAASSAGQGSPTQTRTTTPATSKPAATPARTLRNMGTSRKLTKGRASQSSRRALSTKTLTIAIGSLGISCQDERQPSHRVPGRGSSANLRTQFDQSEVAVLHPDARHRTVGRMAADHRVPVAAPTITLVSVVVAGSELGACGHPGTEDHAQCHRTMFSLRQTAYISRPAHRVPARADI